MASTKASRKAKRDSYGKSLKGSTKVGTDNGSMIAKMKARKTHNSKDAITKGAVKKSDAQAKGVFLKAVPKGTTAKPASYNGRVVGRQLIRWTASTDQVLLLIMEYELKRIGISIPFDAIAKRLALNKGSTGACIQQRLQKLRKEMLARGSWVPPLAGRPGIKRHDDARGFVMTKDETGNEQMTEISWDEDAFKYIDLAEAARKGSNRVNIPDKTLNVVEEASGYANHHYNTRKVALCSSRDEVDPDELQSDDDFDSTLSKMPQQTKRITRSSTKAGSNSNVKSFYDSESDADTESGLERTSKQDEKHKPRMMMFNDSEEEQVDSLVVVLPVGQQSLADYPDGVDRKPGAKYNLDVVEETQAEVQTGSGSEGDVETVEAKFIDSQSDDDTIGADAEDFVDFYEEDSDEDPEDNTNKTTADTHLSSLEHLKTNLGNDVTELAAQTMMLPQNQHIAQNSFGQTYFTHTFYTNAPSNAGCSQNMFEASQGQSAFGQNAFSVGIGNGVGNGNFVGNNFGIGNATGSTNIPFAPNSFSSQVGGFQNLVAYGYANNSQGADEGCMNPLFFPRENYNWDGMQDISDLEESIAAIGTPIVKNDTGGAISNGGGDVRVFRSADGQPLLQYPDSFNYNLAFGINGPGQDMRYHGN